MYCWGVLIHTPFDSQTNPVGLENQYNANTIDSERLAQEVIMPTGLSPKKVKVSSNWACAIMDDESVWCWGEELIIPDLTADLTGRETCATHSLDDYSVKEHSTQGMVVVPTCIRFHLGKRQPPSPLA
jgi:hypothetical protein